ncbi:MAG: hypothetical protein Q4G63_07175, partial [Bacteroidia bacterium]|nr:hypothetical protein [Bacteroidia bacterium]
MKRLIIILFISLPFTLSAQIEVKAYKTTDQYNQDVIRIEIKNTGHYTISIRNGGNLFTPFQQTTIYFLSPEERQNEKGSSTGFDGFY